MTKGEQLFLTHIYLYSFTVHTLQHLYHCKVCIKNEKEDTEKNVTQKLIVMFITMYKKTFHGTPHHIHSVTFNLYPLMWVLKILA